MTRTSWIAISCTAVILFFAIVMAIATAAVPHTKHDARCDHAYAEHAYDDAIDYCGLASLEYGAQAARSTTSLQRRENLFYEAACMYQVSMAYFNRDDQDIHNAILYANRSFALLEPIVNEAVFKIGHKDPTKVYSKRELSLLVTMAMLMGSIRQTFPEVGNGT
jgi:hypothetical protein